jgi:hypothetical protein
MPGNDLTEDLVQIDRLRLEGRDRDADFVLAELRAEFPGHPALLPNAWIASRPTGVPQVFVDRPTESILAYRPQIARRPLRPCSAA